MKNLLKLKKILDEIYIQNENPDLTMNKLSALLAELIILTKHFMIELNLNSVYNSYEWNNGECDENLVMISYQNYTGVRENIRLKKYAKKYIYFNISAGLIDHDSATGEIYFDISGLDYTNPPKKIIQDLIIKHFTHTDIIASINQISIWYNKLFTKKKYKKYIEHINRDPISFDNIAVHVKNLNASIKQIIL